MNGKRRTNETRQHEHVCAVAVLVIALGKDAGSNSCSRLASAADCEMMGLDAVWPPGYHLDVQTMWVTAKPGSVDQPEDDAALSWRPLSTPKNDRVGKQVKDDNTKSSGPAVTRQTKLLVETSTRFYEIVMKSAIEACRGGTRHRPGILSSGSYTCVQEVLLQMGMTQFVTMQHLYK